MTTLTRTATAVAALLLLGAVFVRAGLWQWQRAEESRAVRAQFEAAALDAPSDSLPRTFAENNRFRRYTVRGEYVVAPQALLDNMLREGVAGYEVLTALRVPGLRELVIVNRGWVRGDPDRQRLPAVGVVADGRSVSGRLERLPRAALRFGAEQAERPTGIVRVMQFPTADELAVVLGEPVLDYELLLDAAEPDGFLRDWRAPGLPPERHLGYAGQWWLFAAGAWAAAAWMMIRSLRRKHAA